MIQHRFLDELEDLEQNQTFCGQDITGVNSVLVIGTFNPDDETYPDPTNNAQWFYGRTTKNQFWHYFPTALTNQSLHPNHGHNVGVESWKQYCRQQSVVIIDMLKTINHPEILTSQSDRELERRISFNLSNVKYFNVQQAFSNCKFEKVIYSLAWKDARNLPKMVTIRNLINYQFIQQGTINNMDQVKYCKAPWRNDSLTSWQNALN